jgi:peptidoglycan/xylan/chitin deacetylase (PgdA/CDA1 family)
MKGMIIRHGNRKRRVIALTFDDGPHDPYTGHILDILDRYAIKATFFLTGEKVKQNPDIVRRLISDGHEVGNHSYSHKTMRCRSLKWLRNEIERTDELLLQAGASQPIHFRPPYGRTSFQLIFLLKKMQKKMILWDIGPKDFKYVHPFEIVGKVLKKLKPGSIIVLHDGGEDRSVTVEALNILVKDIREMGYKFVTVSELTD